jgi:hypothetical protein
LTYLALLSSLPWDLGQKGISQNEAEQEKKKKSRNALFVRNKEKKKIERDKQLSFTASCAV